MNTAALILIAALIPSQGTGATKAPSTEHQHQVEQSGDQAMGFSHEKTTHHFFLRSNGGVIQVEAHGLDDQGSRDQIQTHLGHIAKMFAEGNFNVPMLVHGLTPPGTKTMNRLKAEIRYAYEPLAKGGRVVISTDRKGALAAVHDFLRFQIEDHRTGDPLTIDSKKP